MCRRCPSGLVLLFISAGVVLGSGGCQLFRKRETPPLTSPLAAIALDQFMGSPLSGPRPNAVDPVVAAKAWKVTAKFVAVRQLPSAEFVRVGPLARLVVGPEMGTAVVPTSKLVYTTMLRPIDVGFDADSLLGLPVNRSELSSLDGGVVPGSTASFGVRLPEDAPRIPILSRRAVGIQISRRADDEKYELAIISDDLITPPAVAGAKPTASTPAPAHIDEGRELILLDRTITNGSDRLLLSIPMTFPQSTARGLIVELTVTADPTDAGELSDAMTKQIAASAARRSAEIAAARPEPGQLDVIRSIELFGAAGTSPRGTLSFLARATDARLTDTVLAVADDRIIELIAGEFQKRLPNLAARDNRSVAWLLDRSTIASLAAVRDEEAARLLPPIQGALSIYAGQAGRQLDVLASLANEASSSEDLYARIVAEHLILLEESSPSLRVSAFDWLNTIGKAPPGYDPLAPQKERRAALERATPMPATVPTTPPDPHR